MEINVPKPISQFIFYTDNGKWLIKINKDGIFFNKEEFPQMTPDQFAQCFIDILEASYNVTFEKRKT